MAPDPSAPSTPRAHGDAPRIVCVGDFPLGSRRAHAINVVKTAGGFARLGWDVLLLCREPDDPPQDGAVAPRGDAPEPRSAPTEPARLHAILSAYAEPGLRAQTLPSPDERTHPPGSDKRCAPMAAWAVERGRAFGAGAMYSRLAHAAVAWADAGGVAIAETHAYIGEAKPGFQRLLDATARAADPVAVISTISRRLRDHYIQRGAADARVVVVPDGVDVELFDPGAGTRVDLPPGRPGGAPADVGGREPGPRAVYAGHLYDHKGIPTIVDAATMLPGVRFELIGGLEDDIARVRAEVRRRGLTNVAVTGWVDHAALPAHLWRASVLLLPPSAREPSKDWTSPVKLGEYLAAGPPIVASRIPALLDWVDDSVVTWFEPDDAPSLARAIERAVAESPEACTARRALAMARARRWSYPSRARAMLDAAGVAPPRPAGDRGDQATDAATCRDADAPAHGHAPCR